VRVAGSPEKPPEKEPVVASDTRKNRVLVYEDRVHKAFKSVRDAERRARRELAALELLAGLEGVPVVLALGLDRRSVITSRVPGKPLSGCERVDDATLIRLRALVEAMLERGVARHSLPLRDVLVAPDGSVGLVDFERTTRRRFPCDPSWIVAKRVTRFHLMRILDGLAPHLLTPREQRRLRWQALLRDGLQVPAGIKRRILRKIRHREQASPPAQR